MNEAWANFTEKLSDTADYLCRETEKFGDRAKLRYRIVTTRKKLDEEYIKLGKIKYSEISAAAIGSEASDKLGGETEECIEKIKNLINEIAELEKAYNTAKNP